MKKLILFSLIAMVLLTACGPNPGSGGDNGNGSGGDNGSHGSSDPLQDLKTYIAETENPSEVKEYLDALMEEITPGSDGGTDTADALVLEYLSYLESLLMVDQTDLSAFPEDAGFKFSVGEGGDYPVIDYHFIEAYSGQISQEMTDFAAFMALDSDKYWAMDAGIVIPMRDLADRLGLAEQFIVNYPDSLMREAVQTSYERYFWAFLAGTDNTPLFPFGTYKAEPRFLDAYNYFLETYPQLEAAKTVAAFQAELEQMNYTAPYTYSDHEKRAAFAEHVRELVSQTLSRLPS